MNPEVDTYTPMRPGDLVSVRRSTITAAEGARGYIVRQYWTHGELVCVIQLFARRSLSRMFIRDLQKISNT